jgi:nucleoside-diphosphate kinase
MAQSDETFSFLCEWYDSQAEIVRKYRLTYFVKRGATNEVEIFDLKNKRVFLKRIAFPSVSLQDIFIGATVLVYSRQLKVVGFCDSYTQSKLGRVKSAQILFPDFEIDASFGKLIEETEKTKGLKIRKIRLVRLSPSDGRVLAKELGWGGSSLAQKLSKTDTLTLEYTHVDGAAVWRDNVGNRLRDSFNVESHIVNLSRESSSILLGPDHSTENSSSQSRSTALLSNCTTCVIKPHAISSKHLGAILSDILHSGKWKISALKSVRLNLSCAEKYLEVYRGVVRNFTDYARELSSSECVALEIVSTEPSLSSEDVVKEFRKLAGPFQWDFAKQLRSTSIRAKYGKSDVQNAIHCTDLAEDGVTDSKYLFSVLS